MEEKRGLLDRIILKLHKCRNNSRLYSMTWVTDEHGGRVNGIEYRCYICDKITYKAGN